MPDGNCPAMSQVTAMDGPFGTHALWCQRRLAGLRHQIINVPARIAHRGHDIHLHTPSHPALGPAPLIGMTSTTQRASRLLHTDQQAASDDQRHGVFDNSG